ncbi:MAG: CBS domain-containing protein [Pseudomonadales bacterium]|nr:CBS domain-containing protein [Pseudomonadales bacterium]
MANAIDVMNTNLVTAHPGEPVALVCRTMTECNVGAVLLVENESLVGIFTERDLLNSVIAPGLNPKSVSVGSVATANPKVVKPTQSITECVKILREQGFRHLPVVEEGKPVGIITAQDFLHFTPDENEQVGDAFKRSQQMDEEGFDPYEYLGSGGVGLPRC